MGEVAGWVAVPEATPEALAFYADSVRSWLLRSAWGLAVVAAFCFGASARLAAFARRYSRGIWFLEVAIFGALLALALGMLMLPPAWYAFTTLQAHGLSRLSGPEWLAIEGRRILIEALVTSAVLWMPYALLRRAGGRAWLYAWLAFVPFFFTIQLLGPVYLDSLFREAVPMRDKVLEARILELARRAGAGDAQVLELKKGAETRAMNAEVTGIGPGARILIWDTTLAGNDERELLAGVAHEIGHYVLRHKLQDGLVNLAVMLLSLYFAQHAGAYIVRRYPRRLGFSSLDDVASAPLLMVLLAIATALCSPLQRALERAGERDADIFALELTRDNRAAATGLLKALHGNLINPRPHPWVHALRGSHPPLAERIELANRYRPWETGAPLKYADRIKP